MWIPTGDSQLDLFLGLKAAVDQNNLLTAAAPAAAAAAAAAAAPIVSQEAAMTCGFPQGTPSWTHSSG
jgi:hypothetical protein